MDDFSACRRKVAAFAQQDRAVQPRIGVFRPQHDDAPVGVDRLVSPLQGPQASVRG
jgi:hypothetical protein